MATHIFPAHRKRKHPVVEWTSVQEQRLGELNVEESELNRSFASENERDRAFQALEQRLVQQQRSRLQAVREACPKPDLVSLTDRLTGSLIENGFVQVTTPLLMSKGHLQKMSIDESHPIFEQVFWVDKRRCLRPMLAPHLYYIVQSLLRLWEPPVRIFEIGPCFRKETKGAMHAAEFTMLNAAEFGLAEEQRESRLHEIIRRTMAASGVDDYTLGYDDSVVYGQTLDILVGPEEMEVGSASMGPHPLDAEWEIFTPWIGVGFGLERLLMHTRNTSNIRKVGRSLSYLHGVRLNI
jgi:phenylalanyl-tRNA synthetase alpha chain